MRAFAGWALCKHKKDFSRCTSRALESVVERKLLMSGSYFDLLCLPRRSTDCFKGTGLIKTLFAFQAGQFPLDLRLARVWTVSNAS